MHKDLFKVAIAALRMRSTPTMFQRLNSWNSPRNSGKERAKELVYEGASKAFFNKPDLSIEQKFSLDGAKLSALTQALTYKGICEQKTLKYKKGLETSQDSVMVQLDESWDPWTQTWGVAEDNDVLVHYRSRTNVWWWLSSKTLA